MANLICRKVFCCFIIIILSLCGGFTPVKSAISFEVEVGSSGGILSSARDTYWGDWGNWEFCKGGMYVLGMRLKTEPSQGGNQDDTAINGISFLCGVIGESSKVLQSPERQIKSLVGPRGSWGAFYECPDSYAVGFQLRSEEWQKNHDDTGANNLRIFCSNSMKYIEGDGLSWGEWTEPQFCSYGWAMCGIRTQDDTTHGRHYDDASINNLDVQCCKLSQFSELL